MCIVYVSLRKWKIYLGKSTGNYHKIPFSMNILWTTRISKWVYFYHKVQMQSFLFRSFEAHIGILWEWEQRFVAYQKIQNHFIVKLFWLQSSPSWKNFLPNAALKKDNSIFWNRNDPIHVLHDSRSHNHLFVQVQ